MGACGGNHAVVCYHIPHIETGQGEGVDGE